jgi:hypothetical protein
MFFIISKGTAGKFFIVYLAVRLPIIYPLSVRTFAYRAPPGNLSDFIYIFDDPINSFSVASSS